MVEIMVGTLVVSMVVPMVCVLVEKMVFAKAAMWVDSLVIEKVDS